jgi:hypothetical protein
MKGPKAPEGKFVLSWGLHNGTWASRDVGDKLTFDSEQEVRERWAKIQQYLDEIGRAVWFAHFTDDQGEQTKLAESTPYR